MVDKSCSSFRIFIFLKTNIIFYLLITNRSLVNTLRSKATSLLINICGPKAIASLAYIVEPAMLSTKQHIQLKIQISTNWTIKKGICWGNVEDELCSHWRIEFMGWNWYLELCFVDYWPKPSFPLRLDLQLPIVVSLSYNKLWS